MRIFGSEITNASPNRRRFAKLLGRRSKNRSKKRSNGGVYVEDVENATGPGFSAQEVRNSVKKAQQAEYKSKLESKNVYRVPRDRFIQLAPQLSVDDQRMSQQNTHLPPGDKLTVLVPQCEQLGMTFSSNKPGTHFLSHVVPGSVAERSGLMQGMTIVAINGHTVEGMPSESLFELIENSHREAMCTIDVWCDRAQLDV
jgi:predicted metalloprotease with PDZ domain